jgi:hypothetical protein
MPATKETISRISTLPKGTTGTVGARTDFAKLFIGSLFYSSPFTDEKSVKKKAETANGKTDK